MNLLQCTWWRFSKVHTFDSRWTQQFFYKGVPVWEIDGREEWLVLDDGTGLFDITGDGKPLYHDNTSPLFQEMIDYIHREDWVDWVLNEMEALWEITLIDEFDIDDDYDAPDICDAAYEWLPHVLPNTYAKVFPNQELIRKLAIAFFIDQTDPHTINFDQ